MGCHASTGTAEDSRLEWLGPPSDEGIRAGVLFAVRDENTLDSVQMHFDDERVECNAAAAAPGSHSPNHPSLSPPAQSRGDGGGGGGARGASPSPAPAPPHGLNSEQGRSVTVSLVEEVQVTALSPDAASPDPIRESEVNSQEDGVESDDDDEEMSEDSIEDDDDDDSELALELDKENSPLPLASPSPNRTHTHGRRRGAWTIEQEELHLCPNNTRSLVGARGFGGEGFEDDDDGIRRPAARQDVHTRSLRGGNGARECNASFDHRSPPQSPLFSSVLLSGSTSNRKFNQKEGASQEAEACFGEGAVSPPMQRQHSPLQSDGKLFLPTSPVIYASGGGAGGCDSDGGGGDMSLNHTTKKSVASHRGGFGRSSPPSTSLRLRDFFTSPFEKTLGRSANVAVASGGAAKETPPLMLLSTGTVLRFQHHEDDHHEEDDCSDDVGFASSQNDGNMFSSTGESQFSQFMRTTRQQQQHQNDTTEEGDTAALTRITTTTRGGLQPLRAHYTNVRASPNATLSVDEYNAVDQHHHHHHRACSYNTKPLRSVVGAGSPLSLDAYCSASSPRRLDGNVNTNNQNNNNNNGNNTHIQQQHNSSSTRTCTISSPFQGGRLHTPAFLGNNHMHATHAPPPLRSLVYFNSGAVLPSPPRHLPGMADTGITRSLQHHRLVSHSRQEQEHEEGPSQHHHHHKQFPQAVPFNFGGAVDGAWCNHSSNSDASAAFLNALSNVR